LGYHGCQADRDELLLMMKIGKAVLLSASDLVGHLNCRHLTDLEVALAGGRLRKPDVWDPLLEVLWKRGEIHEHNYVNSLRSAGFGVVEIDGVGITPALAERTFAAMQAGAEVIVQGAFLRDRWTGRADILRRVPTPSVLGAWSYEVIDTKLARATRGTTLLQLSLYSDLLSSAQGRTPERMHVVAPGSDFEPQSYRTAVFAAYYRHVKRELEQTVGRSSEVTTYPDPREHCDICRWRFSCDERRRRDDHLCLVAGITKVQIAELKRHDVQTVAELAHLPLPLEWKPKRGSPQSYERAREQARVQVEGRTIRRAVYETLPQVPEAGLARLPAPSPGDIFFDLEADPFVGEVGLEYLFGYLTVDERGERHYIAEWAFTPEQEKRAFERFVDFVMARWVRFEGLHIYHYAPYEPGALKRLMGRYATREDEMDRMLRAQLFVDLYGIARQSIRASVESYTIKNLEVFYDYERPTLLADARRALAQLQACLELNDVADIADDARDVVRNYNQDDCVSAQRLRDWLEQVRAGLIQRGARIARPEPASAEPTEEISERQRKVAELVARLTADVSVVAAERNADQHARWILAHTLDWHRRENKSVWWEFFRLSDLPAEDFADERSALCGLSFRGAAGGTARAPIHRYAFPPQETELRGGETLYCAGGVKLGKVEAISLDQLTMDIKKRLDTASVHPDGVFAHDIVPTDPLADALLRIGEYVVQEGITGGNRYRAACDLLLRRPPDIGGASLRLSDETPVAAAVRIAPQLRSGVLAIQGPPGAGKTYTASQMICALVAAGARVGITANSHKVIRNLLDTVVETAGKSSLEVRCVQKISDRGEETRHIRCVKSNEEVFAALRVSCKVAAGTAWLWAPAEATEAVDVLFVDEAAQMSLANVLAVSQACRTLVLLGDPQQLEQPMKGSHPQGTDVSALDHLLQGKATLQDHQGLFLEETWRLHPDICAFTSELFYEARLRSRAGLEVQTLHSSGRVRGTGLRYLPVVHEGNQSSSPEEAVAVQKLVAEILGSAASWTDAGRRERPIGLEDILIMAPYNAQVFELQELLPGARIGTVDKFQGQEAPVVIYSMTSSSSVEAPRGMEFLYSLNRLNVATSRARCVCVLVGSPALFEADCKTPRQMQLANAFCRYLEMAEILPVRAD
jgi:predicted RecB family nuclease